MLSLIRIQKWLVFVLSGITLNMDEEQELTSLNWLLTSNVMPSGIETVPIEAPSSSLPANASSPALAPTKSKRPCTFFFNFFLFLSFEIASTYISIWTTYFLSASLTQAHASKSRPKNSNVANLSSSSSKSKTSSPNNCAKKSSQSHSQSPNNATNKKKLLVSTNHNL